MQELPRDFLVQIAHDHKLSPLEKEVFVECFSRNVTDQVLIQYLKIPLPTFRTRMSGVYRKFGYIGGGPGKKNSLHYYLCEEYRKINPSKPINFQPLDVDSLVEDTNQQLSEKIKDQCGSIRILEMTQPIELAGIFTEVNLLEQIPRSQHLKIDDLMRLFNPEDRSFDRFGLSNRYTETRVSGIELVKKYAKLMILGKPGAGKTTFLKYLAMQCSQRHLFENCVPIFITLKDFADSSNRASLLEYINGTYSYWGVRDFELEHLLKQGRIFMLLDGLDEIRDEDVPYVINQVKEFTRNFHRSRFIITCRIAAQDYVFEQFTEVEVADFNDSQIESFAHSWFKYNRNVQQNKAELFLKKLKSATPIRELASNPLLLTLLCLVFEDSSDFPSNRSELYEEGLNTLLKKWDASRNIERIQLYKDLSLQRKMGLLTQIAIKAFEKSEYFFKRRDLESYISEYIVNLHIKRNKKLQPNEIEFDSGNILRAITVQHGLFVERASGIYSFSHLSFQEYFAARAIVSESDLARLEALVEKVSQRRWHEVFSLAVTMTQNADNLLRLMKQTVDRMLLSEARLISFLRWVNQKASSIETYRAIYYVRAFYFIQNLNQEIAITLIKPGINQELDIDRNLLTLLILAESLCKATLDLPTLNREPEKVLFWDTAKSYFPRLEQQLKLLPHHLRNHPSLLEATQGLAGLFPSSPEEFKDWIQGSISAWTDQLRVLLIKYRNIGHQWQFSEQEALLLKRYYDANRLILDCLSSDCYVSRQLERQIKKTLFSLPEPA